MTRYWASVAVIFAALMHVCHAYMAMLEDSKEMRQACSGMWAGTNTSVEVVFYPNSTGRVTTIIYEAEEIDLIGKYDVAQEKYGHYFKTYICTSLAMQHGLCTQDQLGYYIVDNSTTVNTIQQKQFDFGEKLTEPQSMTYPVTSTGFYCVGVMPLTTSTTAKNTERFHGHVEYHNRFDGQLAAAQHPKLYLYFLLMVLYMAMGGAWLFACFKYRDQIVTVQHFISGVIAFLVIEMLCEWMFYRYYNLHAIDLMKFEAMDGSAGVTATARTLLVLSSVLEAMRDSLSFFLLLIVSMGYGVVRPTIGRAIIKVYILTAFHFVFGVMYSVGLILVLLEDAGAWVVLFIFPLAFTLTAFYMWIMFSLKATIQDLTERHQTFKCAMFKRLQAILMGTIITIAVYFFALVILVSLNGTGDFADDSWKYRWFILDGFLSMVYFVVFALIAWQWRPTGHNMRLAMSDELATDEEAAGATYDVPTIDSDHEEIDADAEEVESVHLQQLSHAQAHGDDLPSYASVSALADEHETTTSKDPDALVFDLDDNASMKKHASFDEHDAEDFEMERLTLDDDDDRTK